MKLAAWLKRKGASDASFGESIGVSRQSIHRYKTGQQIPEPGVMVRIAEVTVGEVTANDFYGIGACDRPEIPPEPSQRRARAVA